MTVDESRNNPTFFLAFTQNVFMFCGRKMSSSLVSPEDRKFRELVRLPFSKNKTKLGRSPRSWNGTSINWENSGRFTVSPDGKRAKKKQKKNNILWKKSNHTACVKWGILLFWFRVLAHFSILTFPSLKLRIEKSKWHNELHREKAQFIGEIFEALLWQSTFIFQIAENWHSFIHNWSSLTTIQLGQLHTSTSHYLNNPISSFSSQQVSNNWFNSSQLQ